MAPYRTASVRDETMTMLDHLQRERERKLETEIKDRQRRAGNNASNSEMKLMWGLEAKVDAQFAYMRRLVRTEGFVVRTMADFDSLDTDKSDKLDPAELQEFIKKRDGFSTKFTIIEARGRELIKDLDVDGDGKVSRTEWLLYMTYLHWQAADDLGAVNLEKVIQAMPAASTRPGMVVYDARGHGDSSGWELGGPAQFHWRCLGTDMLQVASAHKPGSTAAYIFGGCSMGAASALWAALLCPRAVRGLVLYMVPTMWSDRKARRKTLEQRAESKRETDPSQADVSMGAARSDLPPREELESLANLGFPILVVNSRDDPVHPASSAECMGEIFGSQAKVVIIDKRAELADVFAKELGEWLTQLG